MFIEEQRIFERTAREQALRETRKEDDIERSPSRFIDGADENVAETSARRIGAQRSHFFRQDVVDFVETRGAYFGHWLELAQDGEHGFRNRSAHNCRLRGYAGVQNAESSPAPPCRQPSSPRRGRTESW